MQVTTTMVPEDSPSWCYAFDVAFVIVNRALRVVPPMYTLAVYNLAGSNLLNFAQDLPDAPAYRDGVPFFEYMRKKLDINSYVSGSISSASDEGTSTGLVVPKAAEDFTLADLQYLKDPYGREYLSIAQRYGTVWGVD